ncbi:MAG: alpha/beta hydrolase family protein [Acidimicrobiales bacterium]
MHSSRRRRGATTVAVAAILLTLSLIAAACGSSSPETGGSTGTTTAGDSNGDGASAATPAYEDAGPYVPGVTTLDLDGRKVEVWYPADKGAEAGKAKDVFRISTLLPDSLKSVIPDAVDPKYETDAYRDITASTAGPFPVVLFSHGYAAYPTLYAFLLTHLASWGFVVVAPDHVERGLLAAVTQCAKVADDAAVLLAARDLAVQKSNDPTSVLSGTVDPSKVATVGHSAGAAAAVRTAEDPSVATFVALDGGGTGASPTGTTPTTDANGCIQQATTTTAPGSSTTTTAFAAGSLPDKPGMLITGGNDQVIPLSRLQPFYDAMSAPKRLVVIDGAGHNSVTDICLIGADQGGLIAIAGKVGITVPDTVARLFNDGCAAGGNYPAVKQVWEVPRHFIVAQLRNVFGIDPEPVGLGPGIADAFPPLTLDYRFTD